MRISKSSSAIFFAIFIFLPTAMFARHVGLSPRRSYHADHNIMKRKNIGGNNSSTTREEFMMMSKSNIGGDDEQIINKRANPLQVAAGSRLPDCSHACGSCTPCRLVVISFVCASLAEAETCPISYRCICNSKSYPVP